MEIRPGMDYAACVAETFRWLHTCWEMTEHGRQLQPDPFYARAPLLTPVVVQMVIKTMEDLMQKEIEKFPNYHNTAQGINTQTHHLVVPAFDALPFSEQLAIVIGIDKVFQQYRYTDEQKAEDKIKFEEDQKRQAIEQAKWQAEHPNWRDEMDYYGC